MNRPRNRQPRADQGQARGSGRGTGRGQSRNVKRDYTPVPSMRQVQPGAAVSIVLKEDQPTGREVQGVVSEVLTRGDHPRGIKVRLRDGRVGRVQRMTTEQSLAHSSQTDVDQGRAYESSEDRPPAHSLAMYFPVSNEEATNDQIPGETRSSPTVSCPFCSFVGDELAVSHHVDVHLAG